MSFISLVEAKLPSGFRFHPKDEELVMDYLARKVAGDGFLNSSEYCATIVEVDLNRIEPWDLPEMACVGGKEWYFYSLRDRKYATGPRANRATLSGYWKATGKDKRVTDFPKGRVVGMRKTLVFYQGRAPKGRRTDWVMHEFRLEGSLHQLNLPLKEDWVLCRVFCKRTGGMLSSPAKIHVENTAVDTFRASSLPPLMDSFLKSDQTPLTLVELQQVPCFSSFSQASHPAISTGAMNPALLNGEPGLATKDLTRPAESPSDLTHFGDSDPLQDHQKEAIMSVLDRLNFTRMLEGLLCQGVDGEGYGSSSPDVERNCIWNESLFW